MAAPWGMGRITPLNTEDTEGTEEREDIVEF
jgi:hypothetical protein